jgi:hypothetical protein
MRENTAKEISATPTKITAKAKISTIRRELCSVFSAKEKENSSNPPRQSKSSPKNTPIIARKILGLSVTLAGNFLQENSKLELK